VPIKDLPLYKLFRSGHTATIIENDGKALMLVFGGTNQTRDCCALDLETMEW
jgi:hypothetical protein